MLASAIPARLDHVDCYYGNIPALRDVTLAVEPGETLALLGPNGAGKTTAIRLLLGLQRPTAGTALLFGTDPAEPRNRRRSGAMLQVSGVPVTLTVSELITLFASYYPHPLSLAQTLDAASLERLAKRRVSQLSGGEKQRLFFALAICGDLDILFLDEPTVGLDIETRQLMWAQIRNFVARGRSVLLTTHYLGEADALADRIALITGGSLVAQGTTAAIKAHAGSDDLERAYLTLTGAAARLETIS